MLMSGNAGYSGGRRSDLHADRGGLEPGGSGRSVSRFGASPRSADRQIGAVSPSTAELGEQLDTGFVVRPACDREGSRAD